jgi:hypothetical protein
LLTLAPVITPFGPWAVVIGNLVVVIVRHLRLAYAWSGRVLRRHGAAATVLWPVVTGEFDRFKQLPITRVTAGIRCKPSCSRGHRSCCSKDCRLTDPLHAAGSRLNQPTEFVARVGSRFK